MTYHLYQRTITSKGKKIKVWYYWYYDNSGRQIRKSCAKNGKPCTIKREAQAFIENLPDITETKNKITFNQFCKNFYEENSKFIIKQRNRGIDLKPNTIYGKKLYLSYFLNYFGERYVDEISGLDIDNWLCELSYSSSVINHIMVVIEEVEKELYSYHYINSLPLLERYKRKNKKQKGILDKEEISMLFPDDYDKIINQWKIKFSGESDIDAYLFAVMIYTIVSTGMRSSEVRALKWEQFIEPNVILINSQIDSDNKRSNILKKGSLENKKWRIVVLPDKTVRYLNNLKKIYPYTTDYVFERKGTLVSSDYLLAHFKCVLLQNGIDQVKRNITIHSLRFTYNTIMRPAIENNDLRLMLGHVSETMTEYYDKSQAIQHLSELMLNKDKINSIWN